MKISVKQIDKLITEWSKISCGLIDIYLKLEKEKKEKNKLNK